MKDITNIPQNPCAECRVNEATQLCDFVTEYAWTSLKDEHGRMIGPMKSTCDLPMCKSCAVSYPGHDLCKQHERIMKLDREYWKSVQASKKKKIIARFHIKRLSDHFRKETR